MQIHLDVVVAQSTKHSEVIIIGDGVKGVGVSQSWKKKQTVSMYSKQNIFSFCSIIFNFSFIFYFFVGALERQSNGNFFGLSFLALRVRLWS